MKLIRENDRLPNIVKEFVTRADELHMVIQKATLDILDDIQNAIYAQTCGSLYTRRNASC